MYLARQPTMGTHHAKSTFWALNVEHGRGSFFPHQFKKLCLIYITLFLEVFSSDTIDSRAFLHSNVAHHSAMDLLITCYRVKMKARIFLARLNPLWWNFETQTNSNAPSFIHLVIMLKINSDVRKSRLWCVHFNTFPLLETDRATAFLNKRLFLELCGFINPIWPNL